MDNKTIKGDNDSNDDNKVDNDIIKNIDDVWLNIYRNIKIVDHTVSRVWTKLSLPLLYRISGKTSVKSAQLGKILTLNL